MRKLPATRRSFLRGLAAFLAVGATAGLSLWPITPSAAGPEEPPELPPAEVEPGIETRDLASPRADVAPDPMDSAPDEATLAAPLPTASPTPRARIAAPSLIGRESWGARPIRGEYRLHQPQRVTVHHTAVSWKGGNTPAHLRGIQDFHQGPERGWVDIAYHYLIDRNGEVYQGRPETAEPDTATAYDTRGHVGVCLLGDLDVQQPSPEQLGALAHLLAWLLDRHSLSLVDIGGHRDYAATSCPGRHAYPLLRDGSLTGQVAGLLEG